MCSLRFFVARCRVVLLLSGVAVIIAGCSQSGATGDFNGNTDGGGNGNGNGNGGGGGGNDVPMAPTGKVEGSLNGFLNDQDVWFMVTGGGVLAGFGTNTEYVAVFGLDDSGNCVALQPAITMDFDGENLDVSSVFSDLTADRTCAVEFAGAAASCASSSRTAPQANCAFDNVSGEVHKGGASFELPAASISRFEVCDTQSVHVGPLDEFAVVSMHPLGVSFVNDPADIGGLVTVAGRNGELDFATVFTGLDGTVFTGCGEMPPTGEFALSDGRLTIDMSLAGRNGPQGCTVTYDGQAVYCAKVDPSDTRQPGNRSTIVRFEGTGQWTADDARHDMPVMYVLVGNTDFVKR